MIAGLSEDAPVRLLIAENELKAKELYEDYSYADAETLYYPAKDLIFYQADIHGNLLIRQWLQVIQALLERKEVAIITSVGGCMDFLLPLGVFEKHCIHLRNDSELDLDKIRKELGAARFMRVPFRWSDRRVFRPRRHSRYLSADGTEPDPD